MEYKSGHGSSCVVLFISYGGNWKNEIVKRVKTFLRSSGSSFCVRRSDYIDNERRYLKKRCFSAKNETFMV